MTKMIAALWESASLRMQGVLMRIASEQSESAATTSVRCTDWRGYILDSYCLIAQVPKNC